MSDTERPAAWDKDGNWIGGKLEPGAYEDLISRVKPVDVKAKVQEAIKGFEERSGYTPTAEERRLLEDELRSRLGKDAKPRSVYVILMFGPAHGATMQITERHYLSHQAIVVPDQARPIFPQFGNPARKPGPPGLPKHHLYRFDDEYESDNMEECAIYVHQEGCCEQKMPDPAELERRGALW